MCKSDKSSNGIAIIELSLSMVFLLPFVILASDVSYLINYKEIFETKLHQEIRLLQKNQKMTLVSDNVDYEVINDFGSLDSNFEILLDNLATDKQIKSINRNFVLLKSELLCKKTRFTNDTNFNFVDYFSKSLGNTTQNTASFVAIHETNFNKLRKTINSKKIILEKKDFPVFCSLIVANQIPDQTLRLLPFFASKATTIITNNSFFLLNNI